MPKVFLKAERILSRLQYLPRQPTKINFLKFIVYRKVKREQYLGS